MSPALRRLAPLLLLFAEPVASDARSTVLLRRDCQSEIGRQEITLFANGTLRLREHRDGEEQLLLAELGPDELAPWERRLAEVDLAEVSSGRAEVLGEWVERCELELRLAGRPEERFVFGSLDTRPLALGRLDAIARELVDEARRRAPTSRLPADYSPRAGDVLARTDGALFQVVALTGDGLGVELIALEQPLIEYLPIESLRQEFVFLVRRRSWP